MRMDRAEHGWPVKAEDLPPPEAYQEIIELLRAWGQIASGRKRPLRHLCRRRRDSFSAIVRQFNVGSGQPGQHQARIHRVVGNALLSGFQIVPA